MSFNPVYTELALQYFFNVSSPSPLSSHWVSLHSGSVGATGANEIVGAGWYGRQEVRFALSDQNTGVDVSNNAFDANSSPIPIILRSFGVWDSRAGGNFLFGGPLDESPMALGPAEILAWLDGGLRAVFTANGNLGSDVLTSNVAKWFLGLSPSRPTTVVAGYHYGSPGSDGRNEYTGGGYSRTFGITFAAGAANDGSIENSSSSSAGASSPRWSPDIAPGVTHFSLWGDGSYLLGGRARESGSPSDFISTPQGGATLTMLSGDLTLSMAS